MVNYILKFEKLLKSSFVKRFNDSNHRSKKYAILFSGGVDSSLVAKLAKDCGFSPTLLSLKTEKAKDIEHIEKTAEFLKLPLVFVEVNIEDIKKNLPKLKKILRRLKIDQNLMQLSLGLAMYLLAKKAKDLGFKVYFCGQGSDELFAGYFKYKRLKGNKLKKAIRSEFKRLKRVDKVRDEGIFKEFRIQLFSPFLDKEVVEFAFCLPIDLIKNEGGNKIIVRKLAKKLGLPEDVYRKPKKAMQYSSGMQKLVRKALK